MFFAVAHAGSFNPAGHLGVAVTQMLMLFDSARLSELQSSCLENAQPVPICRGSSIQPT